MYKMTFHYFKKERFKAVGEPIIACAFGDTLDELNADFMRQLENHDLFLFTPHYFEKIEEI